jgi:hypothetical protein
MILRRFAGLFLVGPAVVLAAPAAATPPPVRLPVIVVSADPEAGAVAEAYIAYLSEKGFFSRQSPAGPRQALRACIRQAKDQEDCVRNAAEWKPGGAAVVVLVSGQATQAWRCIGVAAKPANAAAQAVAIDVRDGLFGPAEARTRAGRAATGCLIAAGSESGW